VCVCVCKYKYQVSVDGTVAAYRLPYLLAGDSVVLKQNSSYYEFFYKRLRPYEHYIPLSADLSDLLDRIQWAKDHDAQASHSSLLLDHYPSDLSTVSTHLETPSVCSSSISTVLLPPSDRPNLRFKPCT